MNYVDGPGEPERVKFCLELVKARTPIKGLRVLDLACRIGSFATAFSKAGASVVGVEGRQSNLDHAPKSRVKYVVSDVRTMPDLGTFDVTLCLGILYHLPATDALALLERMRGYTTGFAVLDTHIGRPNGSARVGGRHYLGEPNPEAPSHPWSALDSQPSWWFTPDALEDAIRDAGWTHIEHIDGKGWEGERADRRWLVMR